MEKDSKNVQAKQTVDLKKLLENSDNINEYDNGLWYGPNVSNLKPGKEYVYGFNDENLLENMNIKMDDILKDLIDIEHKIKKRRNQEDDEYIEFRITGYKSTTEEKNCELYNEETYKERWNKENRPPIWDLIDEMLKHKTNAWNTDERIRKRNTTMANMNINIQTNNKKSKNEQGINNGGSDNPIDLTKSDSDDSMNELMKKLTLKF